MLRTFTTQLISVGAVLLLSSGISLAASNYGDRDIPATSHQIQTLNLNSGVKSNPRYQFSRKSADYAALLPVTRHQANVLKLQDVSVESRGSV